jgi:DnaK suppressor protein
MTATPTQPTQPVAPSTHRFPAAGTSARPVAPSAEHFAAAGPATGLVELPDPAGVSLTSSAEVDAHLARVETARQRQLEALASKNLDTVAAAYRATVERILEEVRAARARLAAGRYGVCTSCDGEIALARLEFRAWVAMCAPCARQHDH